MGKRGGKKKLSKKPKSARGRKVGIVCHSTRDSMDGYTEVKIYVVDIDRELGSPGGMVEHYAPATPTVQFIFPVSIKVPCVCILKSTVYIFGGYKMSFLARFQPREKFAKKFVLSDKVLAQGNYRVEGAQLDEFSDMNHVKLYPKAVPTPDRKKIIVFELFISVEDSSEAFELYDPEWDSWETLPGLPWTCDHGFRAKRPCSCSHSIKSYGFVGKSRSHFFVETNIGSFALDLVHKKWTTCGVPAIPESGYFVTAKDRYLLTTRRAYDLVDGEGFLLEDAIPMDSDFVHGPQFPLSTFVPPKMPCWLGNFDCPSMIPFPPFLVNGGQACNTCILQMDTAQNELPPRILIDVCHTDLATLETTVSKCVSLHIDFLESLVSIVLISV